MSIDIAILKYIGNGHHINFTGRITPQSPNHAAKQNSFALRFCQGTEHNQSIWKD